MIVFAMLNSRLVTRSKLSTFVTAGVTRKACSFLDPGNIDRKHVYHIRTRMRKDATNEEL